MIITVFGATGQVGKRIVSYALAKGYNVRAFGRNVADFIDEDLQTDALEAIRGSVFSEEDVLDALAGADAVVSALGGGFDGVDKTRSLGMKTIVTQMQKANIKNIVALGNTAVLDAADGGYLLESPHFPKEFLPVGKEHLQAYLHLKNSDLNYTFICSPAIIDGDATKNYVTSETHLPVPDKGFITSGDLAHFMISEIEQRKHMKQRVGISAA